MGKRDPRIDAYIAKAQPFAGPILKHLRAVIHEACPTVVETLKWSHPSFEYNGLLCGFAAFKAHATFGFWKHGLIVTGADAKTSSVMRLGRLTSVDDLPSDARLRTYVKRAMKLNDDGVPAPHVVKRKTRRPLPVPADLRAALSKDDRASAAFEAFPPSHRREYIQWITEAKMAETRERRITTAVAWLAEGKGRNWKYER